MSTKRCNRCKATKLLGEFYRLKPGSTKDGYSHTCRTCQCELSAIYKAKKRGNRVPHFWYLLKTFEEKLEWFQERCYLDPNSGCWIWENGQYGGYGVVGIGPERKTRRASRVAYEQFVGPIPEGMQVLHKCDVKMCVNPRHLFLGSITDNMRDMIRKGRKHQMTAEMFKKKLTPDNVVEMRRQYAEGATVSDIARQFGVSEAGARSVVKRRSWKTIP